MDQLYYFNALLKVPVLPNPDLLDQAVDVFQTSSLISQKGSSMFLVKWLT